MLSRLRAVFFDVDFTLIYPGPTFQGVGYADFCSRHGVANCNPAAFHEAVASASSLLDEAEDHAYDEEVFVRYIRHIIERMGGTGEAVDACAREIYREWAACHHFSLYDDVVPALRAVRQKGLLIGLISNTHRSLGAFQSHFELEELVAAAISSREHGYNKPHPSIFQTAMRLLAVGPDEALMVGDSFGHDIEGARAVGMHAVWLRRSSGLPGAAAREAATVPVICSLRELPDLLPSANGSRRASD